MNKLLAITALTLLTSTAWATNNENEGVESYLGLGAHNEKAQTIQRADGNATINPSHEQLHTHPFNVDNDKGIVGAQRADGNATMKVSHEQLHTHPFNVDNDK